MVDPVDPHALGGSQRVLGRRGGRMEREAHHRDTDHQRSHAVVLRRVQNAGDVPDGRGAVNSGGGGSVRFESAHASRPRLQPQRPIGQRREPVVVGDDDQRDAALAVELEEQLMHVVAGGRVEVAGRLVGEHGARRQHDGARDGDALLLAARQLAGLVLEAVRRGRPASSTARAARAASSQALARDQRRHHDVLERGEVRQQVMELEDEADLAIAERGELPLAHAWSGRTPSKHTSPAVGRSSAPRMCSSVLLPTPDSPTIDDLLARCDVEVEVRAAPRPARLPST